MIEECFEYNQHFVAMMNIINLAKKQNIKGKFERHHVIPKCFYKVKGLEIDNSPDNLVNLTYEQHQKVHELAVLCAKEIVLAQLRYASRMMNNTKDCRSLGGHLSEKTRSKMSESKRGKKRAPFSEETRAKMRAAKLGENNTAKRPEVRAKISASVKISMNKLEVKAKQRAATKIAMNRPEVRAKITAARKYKHWHLENGKRVYTEA